MLLLDRLRGREKFKDGRSKGWQPVDISEFADGDRRWERLAPGDMGACGKDRALLDDNLRGCEKVDPPLELLISSSELSAGAARERGDAGGTKARGTLR